MPEIDHVGVTLRHKLGHLETSAATDDVATPARQPAVRPGGRPLRDRPDRRRAPVRRGRARPARGCGTPSSRPPWPMGCARCSGSSPCRARPACSTSTRPSRTCSTDARHLAELFAVQAALAYGHVREHNLQTAMSTRQTIGQAVGIVMERYGLDADRAFEHLVRVSANQETKLRDLATRSSTRRPGRPTHAARRAGRPTPRRAPAGRPAVPSGAAAARRRAARRGRPRPASSSP